MGLHAARNRAIPACLRRRSERPGGRARDRRSPAHAVPSHRSTGVAVVREPRHILQRAIAAGAHSNRLLDRRRGDDRDRYPLTGMADDRSTNCGRLFRADRNEGLLRSRHGRRRIRSATGRGLRNRVRVHACVPDYRRSSLGRACPSRIHLVPRTEPVAAASLRPAHGRMPRCAARRSREREPGRRVDARLPAGAAGRGRRGRALERDADADRRPCRSRAGRERAMSAVSYETLFHRSAQNPVLTAADWPYPVHTVCNAGATLLPDGTTLLLCRVEDRRGHSHLCAARSADGVTDWTIDAQPTLRADPDNHPEELWGIEDPRITFVPELGKYAIAYTAFGKGGPGVSLAMTEDFVHFERLGLVMQADDKDAALLPRRVDGMYALVHRPIADSGAHG